MYILYKFPHDLHMYRKDYIITKKILSDGLKMHEEI